MASVSRKRRGANSQVVVAEWWRGHGAPFATDAGAGRPGRDVLHVPGLSVEVKARADFSPLAWLRQSALAAGDDLPIVVWRANGMGPAAISTWPVMLTLGDFTQLYEAAESLWRP